MKATVGRIWEAASRDAGYPVLTHVRFDAVEATLAASNSFIAARVPCEVEDGDESCLIPAAAIEEADGRSLRVADGKATLQFKDGGERSWPVMSIDVKFPAIDELIDRAAVTEIQIAVDPNSLQRLGAALGVGGKSNGPVVLHPVTTLTAMRVHTSGDVLGVIMPSRVSGGSAA